MGRKLASTPNIKSHQLSGFQRFESSHKSRGGLSDRLPRAQTCPASQPASQPELRKEEGSPACPGSVRREGEREKDGERWREGEMKEAGGRGER